MQLLLGSCNSLAKTQHALMCSDLPPALAIYLGLSELIGVSSGMFCFYMDHRPMDFDWAREARTWGRYLSPDERLNSFRNVLIFTIGIPLLWPAFMILIIHDYVKSDYKNWYHFKRDPASQFKCQPKHLLRRLQLEEAEAVAHIHDPLGRTPSLPFGHLFTGWCAFLAKKTPALTLWEFEIPPKDYMRGGRLKPNGQPRPPVYKGYALARGRSVRAEFFVTWSDQQ